MRTIHLKEHKEQEEPLSSEELRQLVALPAGLIDIRPALTGMYTLRPRSRVGTIALPSLRVLIRPKVGISNLFFLLGYANGIRWTEDQFPYEEDDLLRALAWWFDRETGRAVRFGLVREYMDREEPLATLRGRLAIDRQLATRPGQRTPVECRFQDYSEDTAMNRVLKAAHVALLRLPGLDVGVATRLRYRSRRVFADVASVQYGESALPDVSISRLNQEWETAYRLGRMILRRKAFRDTEGRSLGETFIVDMNALFEQFLAAVIRERLRESVFSLETQARRRLTSVGTSADGTDVPAITMRPDLLITRGAEPVAVADAKYKQIVRVGDWEHPDVYQLVTYCTRLGLRRGLLIYAGPRSPAQSRLVGNGMVIATVGVDLDGGPGRILRDAALAADLFISHAAEAGRLRPRGAPDRRVPAPPEAALTGLR